MAGNRVVNFHRPRSEERLAGPHRVAGRRSADPTTGREKGALMQTPRVCVRHRRRGRARPLRQHTRVRTLTRPAPRLVRGRAAPFNPPGPPMAARDQPRTPAGACAPCTLACLEPSHLRQASSGVRGQTAPGARPRRRPRRAGAKSRKGARRWAVPCHGAWQGTPRSVGAPAASSLVLSARAGRLREDLTPPPRREGSSRGEIQHIGPQIKDSEL